MYSFPSLLVALVATAAAKTIVITAGSGGFVFSPDSVTAAVNDVLEFHFVGSIHSAVSGDFSSPCAQSSDGFDSGSVSSSDVFQVTVKNLDPIWFFCGTPSHCQGGMVGVVNPPSSGDTLAAYKTAAGGTSSTTSSGKTQGGVVVPVGSSGSSSSASSASSAASSTTATTSSTYSEEPGEEPTTTLSLISSVPSSSNSTPTGAGSPTTSSSGTASPTPKSTGAGNSLVETSGKVALLGMVFGLGVFVVLMA